MMLVSEMEFLRDHWYPVATVDQLNERAGPCTVRLFGEDYVLWQTAAQEYSLSEPFCPHRSAHLSGGWVADGEIVCPYHGWQFDGGGRCTLIPQMDEGLPTPPRARLETFPAQAHYGVIWACIGDDPVSPRPPVWAEAETESTWRFFVEFFETWRVAAPRIIDNNLDLGHVAFVHRGTFTDPGATRIPDVDIGFTEHGFTNRVVSAHPGGVEQRRGTAEVELLAPLTSRSRQSYHGAHADSCFLGAATPIDDDRSIYVRLTGLAGTEDEQPWDAFHALGCRERDDDRVILESTPRDFPVDVTSEIHLPSDRPTLEYRRYLMSRLDPTPLTLHRSA